MMPSNTRMPTIQFNQNVVSQNRPTAIYWLKAGETLCQIIHLNFSAIHAIDFLQGVGPFVKRDLLDDGQGHLKNIIPFEGGFL